MDEFSLNDSGSEPVAPVFFSDETGKPFTHCKLCNKELVESNSVYTIEKAYVRNLEKKENKLIFEFVYCNDCMEELRGSISKESMQRITAYFQSNSNIVDRYEKFSKSNLFDADSWINNCIINNSDISEIEEYQLYCSCKGGNMLFNITPYMISGKAIDEIVGLLSSETLETLNNLWDRLLDLPSELKDIFKTRPILI